MSQEKRQEISLPEIPPQAIPPQAIPSQEYPQEIPVDQTRGQSGGQSEALSPTSLSHLNAAGEAHMVDVSGKVATVREAIATGTVKMRSETLGAIEAGNTPKGDVLSTARLAGIMAAKQTSQLIPLCHPLPLQKVAVEIVPDSALPGYRIEARVKTKAETGVEMEALTAVGIAALTLYDMAKALEKSIVIGEIKLVQKTGGKSGDYSDFHGN